MARGHWRATRTLYCPNCEYECREAGSGKFKDSGGDYHCPKCGGIMRIY